MGTRLFGWAARRRHALWAAVLLVFTMAGTTGATAGVMLHLGVTNTANATTTLSGTTGGAQLTVANSSTGAAARAIVGTSRSASVGTGYLSNSGGGPALGLQVAPGKAPLVVNSSAGKATNLNADKLDGLDGAALARGKGVIVLANRISLPVADSTVPFLTLPGLGTLHGLCAAYYLYSDVAIVNLYNPSDAPLRVFTDYEATSAGEYRVTTLEPSSQMRVSEGRVAGAAGRGMTVEIGAGSGATNRSASVEVRAFRSSSDSGCEFQATAVVWSGAG